MSGVADGLLATELPITKAALRVASCERSTIFTGMGRIDLGPCPPNLQWGQLFERAHLTTTIKNFFIQDAIIDSNSMALLKDGCLISETFYLAPEEMRKTVRINEESLIKLDDTQDVIFGCNRAHWAYQHWVTQCLPAIDWSLRQTRNKNTLLALPPLRPWQEDTLALLGHGAVSRLVLHPEKQYKIPNSEYCEFLNGKASFGISRILMETSARILCNIIKIPTEHRVIYVPCTNPHYGKLVNEPDLISLLRGLGVHILTREALTMGERISHFYNAEVVIGPHGEGLTDVLFCRPGTLIWELLPGHYMNACYNHLAQMAELEYWGDVFETEDPVVSRDWRVDLSRIARHIGAILRRLSPTPGNIAPIVSDQVAPATIPQWVTRSPMPLDDLMMEFESLGDNCEFGLIQRIAGVEPLGLLRFSSILVPLGQKLERLVVALDKGFEGLGLPETITVHAAGEPPGPREFMVKEIAYDLLYHSGIYEGQVEADTARQRQYRYLNFLRRKLLEDLKVGEKIWVWKCEATVNRDQVSSLLDTLRRYGPNVLLWVVEADATHLAGSVERLDVDLLKGYVERFAPLGNAPNVSPRTWFIVCQNAYDLCHPPQPAGGLSRDTDPAPIKHSADTDFLQPGPVRSSIGTSKSRRARFMSWVRRVLERH